MRMRTELLEQTSQLKTQGEFEYAGSYESYLLSRLPIEDLIRLFRLTSQSKYGYHQDFLPKEFWEDLSSMFTHWDPGEYFGKKYTFFGRISASTETMPEWRDFAARYVDVEGRSRMAAAITTLAEECLKISGEPSPEQQKMFVFVFQFLHWVWLTDGDSSPSRQLQQALDDGKIRTMGDVQNEVGEVFENPEVRKSPLLDLLQRCSANKNFRRYCQDLR